MLRVSLMSLATLVAIFVLLMGTSGSESKLAALSGNDVARVTGGEATAGCWIPGTGICPAPDEFCLVPNAN